MKLVKKINERGTTIKFFQRTIIYLLFASLIFAAGYFSHKCFGNIHYPALASNQDNVAPASTTDGGINGIYNLMLTQYTSFLSELAILMAVFVAVFTFLVIFAQFNNVKEFKRTKKEMGKLKKKTRRSLRRQFIMMKDDVSEELTRTKQELGNLKDKTETSFINSQNNIQVMKDEFKKEVTEKSEELNRSIERVRKFSTVSRLTLLSRIALQNEHEYNHRYYFNLLYGLYPNDPLICKKEADNYFEIREFDKAINLYNKAINKSEKILTEITNAQKQESEQEELLDELAIMYNNRALAYNEQGNYSEALTNIKSAVNKIPNNEFKNNLAAIYWNNRNVTDAMKILSEVITRSDDYNLAYTYCLMGIICWKSFSKKGSESEAYKYFEKAMNESKEQICFEANYFTRIYCEDYINNYFSNNALQVEYQGQKEKYQTLLSKVKEKEFLNFKLKYEKPKDSKDKILFALKPELINQG